MDAIVFHTSGSACHVWCHQLSMCIQEFCFQRDSCCSFQGRTLEVMLIAKKTFAIPNCYRNGSLRKRVAMHKMAEHQYSRFACPPFTPHGSSYQASCLLRTASWNCNRSKSGGRHYTPNNTNIAGSSSVNASIAFVKDSRTPLVHCAMLRGIATEAN